VVVVPFRALLGDMVQRMKDVGIACMEWRAGEVNPIREDGFISTGNATDSASVGVQAN